jgi:GGDEF domain-containing protein
LPHCAQFVQRLSAALEIARRSGSELSVVAIELDHGLFLRILLPATKARAAHRLAEEFRRAFQEGTGIRARAAIIEAAVGTATYPEDGTDAADLCRFADWAAYCDKHARQMALLHTVHSQAG